ncbi:MAG: succinate dehydrogenase assembly factor 2 [Candidatus Accumulibacter sp.]|jgi:succinate dehydrogenase flavin-adding protein (antitoxin of CptAB toxin-antitoxin module)|nr:succinate dehydrogenase assembly factor 2 [Accumulibacter sp.]
MNQRLFYPERMTWAAAARRVPDFYPFERKRQAMLSATEIKRLRWRCTRRAMLEMDLLLGNFLERRFAALNPEQQAAFAVLAEMEDIELRSLTMGGRDCQDPVQRQVLVMLREYGAD